MTDILLQRSSLLGQLGLILQPSLLVLVLDALQRKTPPKIADDCHAHQPQRNFLQCLDVLLPLHSLRVLLFRLAVINGASLMSGGGSGSFYGCFTCFFLTVSVPQIGDVILAFV